MRVVLAINAHISKVAAHGPGKLGYMLARDLLDRGALSKVLCYSVDNSVDIPKDIFFSTERWRLIRKAFGLGHQFGELCPRVPVRRFEERYFDVRSRSQLRPGLGSFLFCTKPVSPDLILAAKQLGWGTAMSTSVLHPRFNMQMVRSEQSKWGLSSKSVYTDERRVEHLERALTATDYIITANKFFVTNHEQYGISRGKFELPQVERPHEGVDVGQFYPSPSSIDRHATFRVLHVSHMTLIKGVQYLLQAWKKVEREIDGELVLVGGQDDNVRELIKRSGITKIRVTGPQNPLREYRQASVFVSPSISDAGPNTVLEAMACGTPAIVSNHCGISGFIDHSRNGMTYQYDDPDQLAEMIWQCYRNADMRRAMAKEALNTARNFPVSDYASELVRIIERLIERNQAR